MDQPSIFDRLQAECRAGTHRALARRLLIAGAALVLLAPTAAWSQRAISTRAGLIHYVEGVVTVDDVGIEPRLTELRHLELGERLHSGFGRAEIVLAPARVLRVGRYSEFELLGNDLIAPELRLHGGAVIVEWTEEKDADSVIAILYAGSRVELREPGRYRITADPRSAPALKVFQGKALVKEERSVTSVGSGKQLSLGRSKPEAFKFIDILDEFDRWSLERAREVAREARAGEGRDRAGRGPGGFGRRGRGRGGITGAESPVPLDRGPEP